MNKQGIMPGGKSHIKGGPEGEDGPYKIDGRHDGPENDGCNLPLPKPKSPKLQNEELAKVLDEIKKEGKGTGNTPVCLSPRANYR